MKTKTKILIAAAAVIVCVTAVLIAVNSGRKKKSGPEEIISLIVSNKEKIAEMVTYRYSRDTLVVDVSRPSGLAQYISNRTDTVAVFIARPTICAGVDLSGIRKEDFEVRNDTLFVHLPAPEILDVYLNASDMTRVYVEKGWDIDFNLKFMAEKAKSDLRRDVLKKDVVRKAGEHAERILEQFFGDICRIPVVVDCAPRNVIVKMPEQR